MKKLFIFIILAALAATGCTFKATKPEFSDPVTEFNEANKKIEQGLYQEARQKLEYVKRTDSTFDYAPLAQLRIADSHLMADEPEIGIDEYREFLELYPRHRFSSYAQYKIGTIYFDLIKGPDRGYSPAKKAIEEFEKLMAQYPRNPYRESVSYKLAFARDILAEHEFMVGRFYYDKSAVEGALERLLGLYRNYPSYSRMDQVLYRIAACYEALGDSERAGRYLGMAAERYPEGEFESLAHEDAKRMIMERQKMAAEEAEREAVAEAKRLKAREEAAEEAAAEAEKEAKKAEEAAKKSAIPAEEDMR